MYKILLGVCGSNFTSVGIDIAKKLKDEGFLVKVVVTKAAENFIHYSDFLSKASVRPVLDAEQSRFCTKNSAQMHIELCDDNDCLLVAPCTANTLAKFAAGIADNILTTIFRSWNFSKPIFIAPAMHPRMWENHLTKEHIAKILSFSDNINIIMPHPAKENDTVLGALAPIDTIYACINSVTPNQKKIDKEVLLAELTPKELERLGGMVN